MLEALDRDGFAIVPHVVAAEVCSHVGEANRGGRHRPGDPSVRRRGESTYAMRGILRLVPEVQELAGSAAVHALLEPGLGPGAFPVQGLLFDKTPDVNWKVPWHQDGTIALRERVDTPGFGAWTVKDGVPHCRPPAAVLERMVALRLHLDDCGPENAPLRVLPGSHTCGLLNHAEIQEWRKQVEPVSCSVPAGGALLMRPLLLHASSPAIMPARQRVVHLVFAAEPLPDGLQWAES